MSFAWDFGDGGTATGAAPSHTYAQPGSYVAHVTASNSLGHSTAEVGVQVHASNPNAVAIAGLTATNNGPTSLGEATSFAANVKAGTDVSFAWAFGDSKAGVGASPTHIYSRAGTYTVHVTASNSVSQATAEMQVVVERTVGGQSSHQIYLPVLMR
jgi:PKD repeat protein